MLTVLLRWLHIIPAMLVVGGVFFMRIVLPAGLAALPPEARSEVLGRCRRIFKMVVHTSILLLLISGTYNSVRLFPEYNANPGFLHGLWGMHVILALVVFGISLWLLSGQQARPSNARWMAVNLVLLVALVMVASTLKWARETSGPQTSQPPAHSAP